MKKTLFIILFLAAFVTYILPQERPDKFERPMLNKKLQELEKIKLIETLNLDETTTLKFFSRRNTHRKKMMELNDEMDVKETLIEEILNNDGDKAQLKTLINEHMKLEQKISDERTKFLSSLTDILSDEQRAKLILFEKKFRQEIRNILMRERGKRKINYQK